MFSFLGGIWQGFKNFLALFVPFGKGRPFRLGPTARLVLHLFLVTAVLVGLFFLNAWLRLAPQIDRSWIGPIWLPLLVLILYLLGWVAWWLWKLWNAEPDASDYPDIDQAWDQAVAALNQAGLRLTEVPLFLVLGRPEGPEDAFFNQVQLAVPQTPAGKAPLHVYATRDAIYVTCAGASLLGRHATILALEDMNERDEGANGGDLGADDAADKTMPPRRKVKEDLHVLLRTGTTALERRERRRMLRKPLTNLLARSEDVEQLSARLTHLCRLLMRDRRPLCPINGLLVVIPLGGTDTSEDAEQTAEICHQDLATVRKVFKLHCPMFALLSDLETFPGFREFIGRQNPRDRQRRLGQRFPLAPLNLQGQALQNKIGESVQWLCHTLVHDWMFDTVQLPGAEAAEAVKANAQIVLFLDEMSQRCAHLGRILTHGLARHGDAPLLYGGCYLAGTGASKEGEQGFVRGVLNRLSDEQNYVSWTDQAVAEDTRYHRLTNLGYLLIAGLVAAALIVVAPKWFGDFFRR